MQSSALSHHLLVQIERLHGQGPKHYADVSIYLLDAVGGFRSRDDHECPNDAAAHELATCLLTRSGQAEIWIGTRRVGLRANRLGLFKPVCSLVSVSARWLRPLDWWRWLTATHGPSRFPTDRRPGGPRRAAVSGSGCRGRIPRLPESKRPARTDVLRGVRMDVGTPNTNRHPLRGRRL